MFKIKNNPSKKDISEKFAILTPLVKFNRIKSNQDLIVSVGMDEKNKNYTMEFTFKNFINSDSEKKPFSLSFPIVSTDGFTAENAKVAYWVFLHYFEQDKDLLEEYVSFTWKEYNLHLHLHKKLPNVFNKYFNSNEIKQITD